jgi:CRISPR-associated exonuclease Cas4
MDDYLPLAYLNAWEYCHRRFYFEYVLGEMEDNEHILQGRYLHENINEEGENWEGETLIRRQQWVWSDRLRIKGIIDAVEETEGQLIPLEYKKGKRSRWLNDHFQLCAAGICLEERTQRSILYGEIFYHASRRRQVVQFSPELRAATAAAIASAHDAAQRPIPSPIQQPQKCQACSLINLCLPFEVKHLKTNPFS